MKTGMYLAAAVLCCASIVPMVAGAEPWEVRREMREGARNVAIEKREAAREMNRCKTRDCVSREMREGQREVNRERREARNEVRQARTENYSGVAHYDRYGRYYSNGQYYGNGQYGNGQYGNGQYGNSQYNGSNDVYGHYHPNGHYCRDGRHIVHLRDAYYRGDRRWYRDGRNWNEYDYVSRYYGGRNGHANDDDDDDDLMRGIVIGAAVVGVIAAIHEANDND